MSKCQEKVEVFSRVVGYFRPVSRWNEGKKEEWGERVTFKNIIFPSGLKQQVN